MKTLNLSHLNRLFFSAAILSLAMFAVSCGDDDNKSSCSKLTNDYLDAYVDASEAAEDGDCDGIEEAYADMISIAKKGKSCDFISDVMDTYEVDTIDELEDALIDERNEMLGDSECL